MPTGSPTPDTLLEAAFRDLKDMLDAAFGVGTFQDLSSYPWRRVFLRHPETRDADLDCLAKRLARRWRLHGSELKRTLRERAENNGRTEEEEKFDLMRIGLVWAAGELEQPQTIRLGESPWLPETRSDVWSVDEGGNLIVRRKIRNYRSTTVVLGRGKWAKDEKNQRANVRPDSLPFGVTLAWYVTGAKAAATATLRDEPWRSGGSVSLQEVVPLEEIVYSVPGAAWEDIVLSRVDVHSLLARTDLSPAERELMEVYLATGGNWAEAARRLGISMDAMKARRRPALSKLRAKAGEPAPSNRLRSQ
jgi:hypothetical protein